MPVSQFDLCQSRVARSQRQCLETRRWHISQERSRTGRPLWWNCKDKMGSLDGFVRHWRRPGCLGIVGVQDEFREGNASFSRYTGSIDDPRQRARTSRTTYRPMATMAYFQLVFATTTMLITAAAFLDRMNSTASMLFIPLWIFLSFSVGAFSIMEGGEGLF